MAILAKCRLKYTTSFLVAMLLTACTTTGDSIQAPSYARMYDNDTYQVICLEASRKEVYVRYDALDTFLRADGSLKSRSEFCQENTYRARTS